MNNILMISIILNFTIAWISIVPDIIAFPYLKECNGLATQSVGLWHKHFFLCWNASIFVAFGYAWNKVCKYIAH